MKCVRCPLYHYYNKDGSGDACEIFGDGWDSPFQYEDKEGCYLDRHFIEEIYENARRKLDKSEITIGEFSEIVGREVPESSAQPDARLKKIADLVDGTIDHFDRDDAMDLLYQIKEVLK